ncbi:hypothetical protein EFW58_02319 [Bacillus velezensis]|nr:hypothetical protein EFW58_02319 [Bacillus velezensis]
MPFFLFIFNLKKPSEEPRPHDSSLGFIFNTMLCLHRLPHF